VAKTAGTRWKHGLESPICSAGGKSGLHFNTSSSVEFFFKLIMLELEKQRVKIHKEFEYKPIPGQISVN
jgi:hypothetical protein